LISTGDATNTVYETSFIKPSKTSRKKSMTHRRYAHGCIALNGYIYAMSGFDNKDADGIAPNTLDSCERYSFHENKWS
jgi:glutamine cyclotransferase